MIGNRLRGKIAVSMRRREAIAGYLFIAPWLIGFICWTAGPMIVSLVLSFASWDLLSPAHYVGIANYVDIVRSHVSLQSLENTAYYTVISVPLDLGVALGVAILLNQPLRGTGLYRLVVYLPVVTSGVATAILWAWLFAPEIGMIDYLLQQVGLPVIPWLISTTWSKPAFVLMSIWGVGSQAIIFLAGLKGVPRELIEAALVDGASVWARFTNVTIPQLGPVILLTLITGIIGASQVFTQAFIVTQGGPADSTLFYVLNLYNNAFVYFKMGYASALAWVLLLFVLILTLLVLYLSRERVYYAGR
jgi:multiple sugar transport system permease protein